MFGMSHKPAATKGCARLVVVGDGAGSGKVVSGAPKRLEAADVRCSTAGESDDGGFGVKDTVLVPAALS